MEMETTNEQSWCLFKYFHNGCILGIFPPTSSRGFKHNHQVVFNFFFQLRLILHFLLFIFSPLHVYLLRLSNSPGNDFTFKEHFAVHLIFNIHFFFVHHFFFFPYYLQLPERVTARIMRYLIQKIVLKLLAKKLLFKSRVFFINPFFYFCCALHLFFFFIR